MCQLCEHRNTLDVVVAEMVCLNPHTTAQKDAYWSVFALQQARYITSAERIARRHLGPFMVEVAGVVDSVDDVSALEVQVLLSMPDTMPLVRGVFEAIHLAVMPAFAAMIYDSIMGKKSHTKDSKSLNDDWIQLAMRYVSLTGGNRIVEVGQNLPRAVIAVVRRAVKIGIDKGWGIDKIARMIKNDLRGVTRYKATLWARTETIAASNYGALEGARSTGIVKQKEWISTRDGRTRGSDATDQFDHLTPDGQTVALDDPFTISGESLMHPGDFSLGASVGNLVQCRCATGFYTN